MQSNTASVNKQDALLRMVEGSIKALCVRCYEDSGKYEPILQQMHHRIAAFFEADFSDMEISDCFYARKRNRRHP